MMHLLIMIMHLLIIIMHFLITMYLLITIMHLLITITHLLIIIIITHYSVPQSNDHTSVDGDEQLRVKDSLKVSTAQRRNKQRG